MKPNNLHTAYQLSFVIILLATVASLGGLEWKGLYRDNDFIRNAWLANDWVTIVVAVPMLFVSARLGRKGVLKAQLVWMGALLYMLYNYAFYLFGAVFNEFFLLYAALFTMSMYALIYGLTGIDRVAIAAHFDGRTPVRPISLYLGFLALPLLIVEGGQCIGFIVWGNPPQSPSLIFALDMAFVIPATLLAGVWLWQRRVWGYILSVMMLVKALTYGLVLSVGAILLLLKRAPQQDALLPFYLFLVAGSAVCLVFLFRRFKPDLKSS